MTDRDRWELRGPVARVQLHRTWYSRRCGIGQCENDERSDTTVVEFRRDGSIAHRWHKNPDDSEWTSNYAYDAAGRLVSVTTENTAGLVDFQRYEYDAAGRPLRLVARDQDGHDRTAESYEYDATGGKRKTLHIDVTAQRPDVQYHWGVEGTDSWFSAPGAATLTTLYNTRDQPTALLFHDGAGRALSRVEFLYDEAGRLLEEAQTRVAELLPAEMPTGMNPAQFDAVRALLDAGADPARRVHRYDGQGHRIETSSSLFGPLGREQKTMAYNDRGDLIEEISEDQQRDYSIDDQGRLSDSPIQESQSRSEGRFRYDYDARDNWIKKIVDARGGTDQDFSTSSIELRTLAYDD
jgi:hypothetical protein